MKIGRRKNVIWGFVAAAVSLFLLLRAMELVPDGFDDMFLKGWPVLLVFAGLSLLFRERLPWANVMALGISVALGIAIIFFAYSDRSSKEDDSQRVVVAEPVSEFVTLLAVNVTTLDTTVEIAFSLEASSSHITGEFVGSEQSEITIEYLENESNGVAEFTLTETKSSQWPPLESVGRGRLVLEIPSDLPVAIAFAGEDGDVSFDLSELAVERVGFDVQRGNVRIVLPEYQPQSPNAGDEPGQWLVGNGDLTVLTPDTIDVQLAFDRQGSNIDPQYPLSYIEVRYGVDGMLRRSQETSTILYAYEIVIPRGLLSLQLVNN